MNHDDRPKGSPLGTPVPGLPKPDCFGKQFLRYPAVCGWACMYGIHGDNTCDKAAKPSF